MTEKLLIQSMTGFASVQRELPQITLVLELRSVNSRFLDLIFKIPDELRGLEPALRERLAGALKRGKLECRIGFQRRLATDRQPSVDADMLASLTRAAALVRSIVTDALPMTVADLLRWPGVMADERVDLGSLSATFIEMADEALGEFIASRQREGGKLAGIIGQRVADIESTIANVAAFVPGQLAQYEEKLTERLRSALNEAAVGTRVPPEETFGRLRQEITLYGLRIDVSEELGRLQTHAQEVKRVLAKGGAVGKRLDFLMQELNREANTVGSKATARELTTAAMELKLFIEQIREQVQNLE